MGNAGLSEAGYVIDAVSDGRDGLYLALKDDYALIILDIMLPGMDGWQILQTLRTAKQTLLFALLQGILSMTESEGWTVGQMIIW